MDHHHPQQWHPRPIQGPTVCPLCSVPHFPFCPPPPPHPSFFNQNSNFPFHPDQYFQRPGFDPYRDPMGIPSPLPPPPFLGNPYDGFGDQRPLLRNPNFSRDSYGQVSVQPHREIQAPLPPCDYGSGNGFVGEGDRIYKRPRVDDGGSASSYGALENGYEQNSERFWSEDERRLKLIRDHGSITSGSPEFMGFNRESNRSDHGSPVFEKQYMQNNNNRYQPQHSQNDNQQNFAGMVAPYRRHNTAIDNNYSSPNFHDRVHGSSRMESSQNFNGQPPLPPSSPPPMPREPSQTKTPFLFPVNASSSALSSSSSYPPVSEVHSMNKAYYHNKPYSHASTAFVMEDHQAVGQSFPKQFIVEDQSFSVKQLSSNKPKIIDASHVFRSPHRASRPGHIVVIFRGLPGSGKSYLAKMLRDLEVENGGDAPRIHSMDDYFMTEVEKIEEGEASTSAVKRKKPVLKKVMEYCYEPEMEEAYRSSMLKAFKKTLEEGVFTFVIVDDRNLRVADFAQFWAVGKSSGYEVYILEATYKDPAGCAARNVHGFTLEDIQKMAGQWEEAPSLYLQLNIKSLFHGDDLKESEIQEVDMDMDDGDVDESLATLQEQEPEKTILLPLQDDASGGLLISHHFSDDGKRENAETNHQREQVKELGRSKWSDDLDEDDDERTEEKRGNSNALSGLIRAHAKKRKSVHWSDRVGNTGFSIGAARKASTLSLVIGPGAGYNRKSNPLPEEESMTSARSNSMLKSQSVFQERLRAEHESFKAIFDKRRQRIGLDKGEIVI